MYVFRRYFLYAQQFTYITEGIALMLTYNPNVVGFEYGSRFTEKKLHFFTDIVNELKLQR